MSHRRKLFGPLLTGMLSLAVLTLVGLWLKTTVPDWQRRWELRSLAQDLRSPSALTHRSAANELVRAGSDGVPWLIEATKDRDDRVRLMGFTAISRTMPLPKVAIPALVEGLSDPHVSIRRQAAEGLYRFGPEASESVQGLRKALKDEDPKVRLQAARTLLRIEGTGSETAFDTLMALLTDPDITHLPDRTVVVPIMRRISPDAEARAVAALISKIDTKDKFLSRSMIECLQIFGHSAADAIPALERALSDDDEVVRCLAALALSEIEGWKKGRARSILQKLVDSPLLSPRMQTQVRWVISTDLVAGSELSLPVHTLREVVAEFRLIEARAKPKLDQPIETGEIFPVP